MLWCCYFKKTLSKNFVMEDDWLILSRTVLIEKTPEQIIFQLDDSNKKVKCTCSVRECVDLSEVAFFLHKSIKDLVTMNDIFDFFHNEKKKPGDFFLICKTN